MGMMKMGNSVPRVGIEPPSLAFQASVLPLHHVGSLLSPIYPHLPICTAPCLRGKCRLLHSSPWDCKSFKAYNYIHTGNGLIYAYIGQVQQPYSTQLVQDPGHSTSVMSDMKMGNIVPRAGIKSTSLVFRASVLPLHHIGSLLMLPLYPRPPVREAPCLRGHCRLLHYQRSHYCKMLTSLVLWTYLHKYTTRAYLVYSR